MNFAISYLFLEKKIILISIFKFNGYQIFIVFRDTQIQLNVFLFTLYSSPYLCGYPLYGYLNVFLISTDDRGYTQVFKKIYLTTYFYHKFK